MQAVRASARKRLKIVLQVTLRIESKFLEWYYRIQARRICNVKARQARIYEEKLKQKTSLLFSKSLLFT
jgi:hypothetical protein